MGKAVTSEFNLLVIEGDAFVKPIENNRHANRYAFISASRPRYGAPWKVSTQSYTSEDRGYVCSGYDYKYGDTITVDSDDELVALFAQFAEDRQAEGMETYERSESSYTFGLMLDQAVERGYVRPQRQTQP